jgi:PEP-CTERM motif
MRTPLAVLRLLLAASASVPGVTARAVPLSLSATEVTWTTETAGNVSSTLTLRLDDMAHPDPGIGQIQLSIAGRVHQPNYRRRYLEVVGMEIYADRGTSSLRGELLDAAFSHPLGSGATGSPTIAGPGTPTYTWVDFRTGITGREIDWTATAVLTVFDVGDLPKSVDFISHYVPVRCVGRERCDRGFLTAGHLDVEVTPMTGATASGVLRVASVPEPSTAVLVALGLAAFGASRLLPAVGGRARRTRASRHGPW